MKSSTSISILYRNYRTRLCIRMDIFYNYENFLFENHDSEVYVTKLQRKCNMVHSQKNQTICVKHYIYIYIYIYILYIYPIQI